MHIPIITRNKNNLWAELSSFNNEEGDTYNCNWEIRAMYQNINTNFGDGNFTSL
jgi:hypothetical protein